MLSRKNFISWYRSPCSSIAELLIPLCMGLLLLNSASNVTEPLLRFAKNETYAYSYPMFPNAKLENDTWVQNFKT